MKMSLLSAGVSRVSPVFRIANLVIALIFAITSTVYGVPRGLLETGRGGAEDPAPSRDPGGVFFIDPLKLIVPENFGSVTERFTSAGTANSKKLIIQIQDSHCNFEAQTNIANIIEMMTVDKDIARSLKLVATEGAQGLVDPVFERSFPDPKVRQESSDYFVKIGWLTGTETYAINFKEEPLPLWGVENKALYEENLDFFKKAKAGLEKEKMFVERLTNLIDVLKLQVFSQGLGALVTMRDGWDTNTVQFTDYCGFIEKLAREHGLGEKGAQIFKDTVNYPNFTVVMETMEIEKKIDSKKIDGERKQMIEDLQKKMVKEELSELVKQSLYLRIGKSTSDMFYSFLKNAAAAKKLDMMKYPNLAGYIEIVIKSSAVNAGALFDEVDRIEKAIKGKMYVNKNEKVLDETIDQVKVLKNLLDLRMTRRDLAYYKEKKRFIEPDALIRRVARVADETGLKNSASGALAWLEANKRLNVAACEGFYEAAIQRDKALVENTITEMEKRKATAVAMVMGGFHTQGTKELFKAKGYSYIVVTPRMTEKYDDKYYLARMLNEQSEFDKLFANTGNRLAAWTMIGSPQLNEAFFTLVAGIMAGEIKDKKGNVIPATVDAINNVLNQWLNIPEIANRPEVIAFKQLIKDGKFELRDIVFGSEGRKMLTFQVVDKNGLIVERKVSYQPGKELRYVGEVKVAKVKEQPAPSAVKERMSDDEAATALLELKDNYPGLIRQAGLDTVIPQIVTRGKTKVLGENSVSDPVRAYRLLETSAKDYESVDAYLATALALKTGQAAPAAADEGKIIEANAAKIGSGEYGRVLVATTMVGSNITVPLVVDGEGNIVAIGFYQNLPEDVKRRVDSGELYDEMSISENMADRKEPMRIVIKNNRFGRFGGTSRQLPPVVVARVEKSIQAANEIARKTKAPAAVDSEAVIRENVRVMLSEDLLNKAMQNTVWNGRTRIGVVVNKEGMIVAIGNYQDLPEEVRNNKELLDGAAVDLDVTRPDAPIVLGGVEWLPLSSEAKARLANAVARANAERAAPVAAPTIGIAGVSADALAQYQQVVRAETILNDIINMIGESDVSLDDIQEKEVAQLALLISLEQDAVVYGGKMSPEAVEEIRLQIEKAGLKGEIAESILSFSQGLLLGRGGMLPFLAATGRLNLRRGADPFEPFVQLYDYVHASFVKMKTNKLLAELARKEPTDAGRSEIFDKLFEFKGMDYRVAINALEETMMNVGASDGVRVEAFYARLALLRNNKDAQEKLLSIAKGIPLLAEAVTDDRLEWIRNDEHRRALKEDPMSVAKQSAQEGKISHLLDALNELEKRSVEIDVTFIRGTLIEGLGDRDNAMRAREYIDKHFSITQLVEDLENEVHSETVRKKIAELVNEKRDKLWSEINAVGIQQKDIGTHTKPEGAGTTALAKGVGAFEEAVVNDAVRQGINGAEFVVGWKLSQADFDAGKKLPTVAQIRGGRDYAIRIQDPKLREALDMIAQRDPDLLDYVSRIALVGDEKGDLLEIIGQEDVHDFMVANPGLRTQSVYIARGLWGRIKNDPTAIAQLIAHEAQHIRDFNALVAEFAKAGLTQDEAVLKAKDYMTTRPEGLEARAAEAERKIVAADNLEKAMKAFTLRRQLAGTRPQMMLRNRIAMNADRKVEAAAPAAVQTAQPQREELSWLEALSLTTTNPRRMLENVNRLLDTQAADVVTEDNMRMALECVKEVAASKPELAGSQAFVNCCFALTAKSAGYPALSTYTVAFAKLTLQGIGKATNFAGTVFFGDKKAVANNVDLLLGIMQARFNEYLSKFRRALLTGLYDNAAAVLEEANRDAKADTLAINKILQYDAQKSKILNDLNFDYPRAKMLLAVARARGAMIQPTTQEYPSGFTRMLAAKTALDSAMKQLADVKGRYLKADDVELALLEREIDLYEQNGWYPETVKNMRGILAALVQKQLKFTLNTILETVADSMRLKEASYVPTAAFKNLVRSAQDNDALRLTTGDAALVGTIMDANKRTVEELEFTDAKGKKVAVSYDASPFYGEMNDSDEINHQIDIARRNPNQSRAARNLELRLSREGYGYNFTGPQGRPLVIIRGDLTPEEQQIVKEHEVLESWWIPIVYNDVMESSRAKLAETLPADQVESYLQNPDMQAQMWQEAADRAHILANAHQQTRRMAAGRSRDEAGQWGKGWDGIQGNTVLIRELDAMAAKDLLVKVMENRALHKGVRERYFNKYAQGDLALVDQFEEDFQKYAAQLLLAKLKPTDINTYLMLARSALYQTDAAFRDAVDRRISLYGITAIAKRQEQLRKNADLAKYLNLLNWNGLMTLRGDSQFDKQEEWNDLIAVRDYLETQPTTDADLEDMVLFKLNLALLSHPVEAVREKAWDQLTRMDSAKLLEGLSNEAVNGVLERLGNVFARNSINTVTARSLEKMFESNFFANLPVSARLFKTALAREIIVRRIAMGGVDAAEIGLGRNLTGALNGTNMDFQSLLEILKDNASRIENVPALKGAMIALVNAILSNKTLDFQEQADALGTIISILNRTGQMGVLKDALAKMQGATQDFSIEDLVDTATKDLSNEQKVKIYTQLGMNVKKVVEVAKEPSVADITRTQLHKQLADVVANKNVKPFAQQLEKRKSLEKSPAAKVTRDVKKTWAVVSEYVERMPSGMMQKAAAVLIAALGMMGAPFSGGATLMVAAPTAYYLLFVSANGRAGDVDYQVFKETYDTVIKPSRKIKVTNSIISGLSPDEQALLTGVEFLAVPGQDNFRLGTKTSEYLVDPLNDSSIYIAGNLFDENGNIMAEFKDDVYDGARHEGTEKFMKGEYFDELQEQDPGAVKEYLKEIAEAQDLLKDGNFNEAEKVVMNARKTIKVAYNGKEYTIGVALDYIRRAAHFDGLLAEKRWAKGMLIRTTKALIESTDTEYLNSLIANTDKVIEEINANPFHPDKERAVALARRTAEAAKIGLIRIRLADPALKTREGTVADAARQTILAGIASADLRLIESVLWDATLDFGFDAGKDLTKVLDYLNDAATLQTALPLMSKLVDFEGAKEKVLGGGYATGMKSSFDALLVDLAKALKEKSGVILDTSAWSGMSDAEIDVQLKVVEQAAKTGVEFVVAVADDDRNKDKIIAAVSKLKGVTVATAPRAAIAKDVTKIVKDVKKWTRFSLIVAADNLQDYAGLIDLANLASLLVSDGKTLTNTDLKLVEQIGLKDLAAQLKTGDLTLLDVLEIKSTSIDEKQEAYKTLGFQA